jgi:hypothetical protein
MGLHVEDLPLVIRQAGQSANVKLQHDVIDLCLQRIVAQTDPDITDFKPREEQVRTLRRLIYGKGDTLLITLHYGAIMQPSAYT